MGPRRTSTPHTAPPGAPGRTSENYGLDSLGNLGAGQALLYAMPRIGIAVRTQWVGDALQLRSEIDLSDLL